MRKRTHFPGRYSDFPKREGESKHAYKARRRLAARVREFESSAKSGARGYHRPGSNKK